MTTAAVARSKPKTIAVWVLRILIGGLFIFAAAMKLSGQPMMVAEFEQIGLGQWFRYFTGLVEVSGGIGLIVPSTSRYGAMLLLLVDIGAFIAQVGVLHMDWIHTIVIAAILALLIYLQRSRLVS